MFRAPGIQKLVSSNKKIEFNMPQKLVHVVNGYAFVSHEITAIVNLREYAKKELDLETEDELEELTKIIDWLNGKSFTKEFWSMLTKDCLLTVNDDNNLEITNGQFTTVLNYQDVIPDNDIYLETTTQNLGRPPVNIDRIGIKGKYISLLNSAFSKEMASDTFIFEFSGKEYCMNFSGSSKDYIFGFVPLSYDEANELTAFMNVKSFCESI